MAGHRSGAALLLLVAAAGLLTMPCSFVTPQSSKQYEGEAARMAAAAAGLAVTMPEAAQARLPDEFVAFAPIVDVLPILPVFFLLLAFLWQASVGFR
eukprot:CAMPEP_0170607960 /NCGR_PEP_ID=MMETSP0224-20130122/21332_1 /TAXON_ID=285029 /ORGANISM="Togula jolla, Strain CCCM 725" /LENGTH=96 /DNA_ID=CAMNT_0010933159 /DNA_START=72 /DNA_END=362 /DNA_ORIENTATION=+